MSLKELKRLSAEIKNSKDFLPENITADTSALSADDKAKTTDAKPWYQNVSSLPTIFQWIQRGPIISLVLGLLATAAIIFCSTSRRNGVRRAGVTVLSSSIALALSSVIVLFMSRYMKAPIADEGAALYQPMLDLLRLASDAVSRWQFITCLVLAVVSGGVLIGLKLTAPPATKTPSTTKQ